MDTNHEILPEGTPQHTVFVYSNNLQFSICHSTPPTVAGRALGTLHNVIG